MTANLVETTPSAALIATFVLEVLIGQRHHYTPVAAVIVMTMLLPRRDIPDRDFGLFTHADVPSINIAGGRLGSA